MNTIPQVITLPNQEKIWTNKFNTFTATVYVPAANAELKSDIINYGFISPYLLVFLENPLTDSDKISFAHDHKLDVLAASYASSVVFISPNSTDWNTASPNIFSEIITNSKIHQYYKDGYIKSWNRFTNTIDGYYIRGAIFRTCIFAYGKSADYIALNCLNHFEGDGLWGKADIAPVTAILSNLSVTPNITADDIPIISYGNSAKINEMFKSKCKYFIQKDNEDILNDYNNFAKKFRRMVGNLDIDPDLEAEGLITEPSFATVKTSSDNNGDDKNTSEHKIGYIAFYNKGILNSKIPLVLGFHGGGDSCYFFSIMAGWQKICHRHNFLLVTIENHLNSSATEMIELIEILKQKYPIDESRIYVTGFSMGGIKSWDMVQEYPLNITAAAPMDATVDIGENVYFQKIAKQVNTTIPVPVFYAGGEITPLPELSFQAEKCLNRFKYILNLNHSKDVNFLKFDQQDKWENKFWGVNGDFTKKLFDETRNSTLTLQFFKNDNKKIYNIFGTISEQGHDCREHTCEQAWKFMSQFSRDKNGNLNGGDIESILNLY